MDNYQYLDSSFVARRQAQMREEKAKLRALKGFKEQGLGMTLTKVLVLCLVTAVVVSVSFVAGPLIVPVFLATVLLMAMLGGLMYGLKTLVAWEMDAMHKEQDQEAHGAEDILIMPNEMSMGIEKMDGVISFADAYERKMNRNSEPVEEHLEGINQYRVVGY